VMSGHAALVPLSQAMPGWREGLTHMTVGEKARFWVPAALAWGARPADRFNPAGDLIYEIELLDVQ
jgi:FKBP-type peptidyl-prolyl cis-trans isomerase